MSAFVSTVPAKLLARWSEVANRFERRPGGSEPDPGTFAMPEETINAAIDQAVAEAENRVLLGKRVHRSCWRVLRSNRR